MDDSNAAALYSIPRLARQLGITPASVRDWIKRGYVDPPPKLPATGEAAYSVEEVERIERWYFERAADGGTRGPGAADRRNMARAWLNARGPSSGDEESS